MCNKRCLGPGKIVSEVSPPTNFTRVGDLNNLFGNAAGDPLSPVWGQLSTQLLLIQEEVAELSEAHDARDVNEIRDALADILTVTYGYYHLLGVCADADMLKVHESNMSKLCRTRYEVEQTKEAYKARGLEVYDGGEPGAWWVKSAMDQNDNKGKFYPAHKFLKNVLFHTPRFAPLVRELNSPEIIQQGDLVRGAGPDQYIDYNGPLGIMAQAAEYGFIHFNSKNYRGVRVSSVRLADPFGDLGIACHARAS